MRLEDLTDGCQVSGIASGEPARVIEVAWHGADAVEVTYQTHTGTLGQRVLYRADEPNLDAAPIEGRPFDASAADFKIAAEAQRIRLAGMFDPMLAVATSDVQPLPHQIRAVYGELLTHTPLRFLLADDPGAGKTIMAGLYVKELMLRDDVRRCLIVAPGGLVEQWQDELYFKFGLRFELLTNSQVDARVGESVFEAHPLLIARMDQLARNDDLLSQLGRSEWDLVVVDEAHRMAAHYFNNKLEKTKRFLLGELLGRIARHLLLLTATPHSGREEDFQLFLTLLDRDRFEGKFARGRHSADTRGLMRRMVKEELLTFEGKPLFPERIAETVPYDLSPGEQRLYEEVTQYVREGMNRADHLDGKRRSTVGFALTVLQRRLASSPEAIYQSLLRRSARLKKRRDDLRAGRPTCAAPTELDALIDVEEILAEEIEDLDEYSAEEIEDIEEELVDSATAAQTIAELEAELQDLADLISIARKVRASGKDRKWVELRRLLQDPSLTDGPDGSARKLIIFTEHRDTLAYLKQRIGSMLGQPQAVRAIHGGVRRGSRREITEEFTKNPECRILLATDAAGEGLNLQAAHLMVNYDLPWNPNRIEQRFGRIHRIGQTQTCRLWNLVANDTREGEVFTRLLAKIDEQRRAYGGKVFDVLGTALEQVPLRNLLMEAIRYGERPEVRARMHQVIDQSVSEGIRELMDERALTHDSMATADIAELRRIMDEARARRLQPHYIESAFREGFIRLGGRLGKREPGRFEITNVPKIVRDASPDPIATKYERVTFELERIESALPRADLLAPGHPLHDAVMNQVVSHWGSALERGTVLVSGTVTEPQLLVGVVEEIVDGCGETIGKRFGYVFAGADGTVRPAGPAPYLDCVAAPAGSALERVRKLAWLAHAESSAMSWIIANQLPDYLAELRGRRDAELDRVREQVTDRLTTESNRLWADSLAAGAAERAGAKVRQSSASLEEKATELERRLANRLAELDRQRSLATKPPRVVTAALVLPLSAMAAELPADAPLRAVETKEVERRGVELVLATERRLRRDPVEQGFNNPGFDILSHDLGADLPIRIEVKARLAGADDFFITHNEVITGKNAAPRYRLALVSVDPRGPEHDQVRYLADPFAATDLGVFDAMGIRGDWAKSWAKGREPF